MTLIGFPAPIINKLYDFLLPYDLWKLQESAPLLDRNDDGEINCYLEEAETLAGNQGVAGFGFKVLSHQFDERPLLGSVLKRRGYQVIYLTRNTARQVLSGIIAVQREIYNTTESFDD